MRTAKPKAAGQRHAVWYAEGLRFRCARCCQCCTGPPGYVWVTREEILRMADSLGLSVAEFARRHCRRAWWRVSLKERANGDCVFLGPDGCRVYPARPNQCRAFPFWEPNLRRRASWEALKRRCPGVGRGKLYSREEIDRIAGIGQPG